MAAIKSSVLLEFNGLSITIINFGGLFALKVGHHHHSKQDHQAANHRLFSMHPRGREVVGCTWARVLSILIRLLRSRQSIRNWVWPVRRRSHRRLIPFLRHKSINATSFIKFNPPLCASLAAALGKSRVGATLPQQYISFSLFCCRSNIASKYPSYQREYQHVAQQQHSLFYYAHTGKSHQFTWLQSESAPAPLRSKCSSKTEKLHFPLHFECMEWKLEQRKVFWTNLWYFDSTTVFQQIFHFLLKLIQKARRQGRRSAKVATAAAPAFCFDRAVPRILHLIPPQMALYSQRILVYLYNIICQSSRNINWYTLQMASYGLKHQRLLLTRKWRGSNVTDTLHFLLFWIIASWLLKNY